MDTNLLLSIAFSVISNFTNVVGVPPGGIPNSAADLSHFVIGAPESPANLYLVNQAGTRFWIGHGVLYGYASPDSFFRIQDPGLLPHFTGVATINSEQAVQLATSAVRKMVRAGDPLQATVRTIQAAGLYQGRPIPFFRVHWTKTAPDSGLLAQVEIDARTSRIVALHVWGPSFADPGVEVRMLQAAGVRQHRTAREPPAPKPSLSDAARAIPAWLNFCKGLGLDPGLQRTLENLNWERCFLYQASGIYSNGTPVAPLCHIEFKNGTCFDSIAGTVLSHFCADCVFRLYPRVRGDTWASSCYTTNTWQALAQELEHRLETQLRLPVPIRLHTSPYVITPEQNRADNGRRLRRVKVEWRFSPSHSDPPGSRYANRRLLAAEFDLETKQVKSIEFYTAQYDGDLWKALSRMH